MRSPFPALAAAAFLAAAVLPARAALVAPVEWAAYAHGLSAVGSPVAGALGLNLTSPLVVGSLSTVMSLQPSLSPQALTAQPPAAQVAAIRGAIRSAAAPLLLPPTAGASPTTIKSDMLVQLNALADALPAPEKKTLATAVSNEMDRRGESLIDASKRVAENFEAAAPQASPVSAETAPDEGKRRFLSRFALRPAAPKADDAFRTIVPKVSKEQLRAELQGAPVGTIKRLMLGQGSEAYKGVFAVAEKTADGEKFYVEKYYDAALFVDEGVPAMKLAKSMEEKGQLGGIEAVDVLDSKPGSLTVRLAFTEGLDMAHVMSAAKNGSAADKRIEELYKLELAKAAASLKSAGWKALFDEARGSLYVYAPPDAGGKEKLAVQFIPSNVVATPDGRFVLIDPF